MFGVAPSATAAEVLAADTGVEADTLDKLLIEYRLARSPERRFDLPTGATVIMDEAAMVPTARLAELAELAERQGWRVALVGDPLQFSAVGRGGMFSHLVEVCGAIELDRVQRFANDWERDASLRLRRGDAGAVEVYDQNGRLHGGNRIRMEATIVRAGAAARARGDGAAMMAPTNEAVVSLNHRAQQFRARSGEIDLEGSAVQVGHYDVVVGDEVATRRKDRSLRTDRGLMVKNRDHWRRRRPAWERPELLETPSRGIEASWPSSTFACRSSRASLLRPRRRWGSGPASRWSAAPFSPALTRTCQPSRRDCQRERRSTSFAISALVHRVELTLLCGTRPERASSSTATPSASATPASCSGAGPSGTTVPTPPATER